MSATHSTCTGLESLVWVGRLVLMISAPFWVLVNRVARGGIEPLRPEVIRPVSPSRYPRSRELVLAVGAP